MKTGRADYDLAFAGAGVPIPEDEPVFMLRGQDVCAPATLRAYAKLARTASASAELVGAVLEHADAMEAWQARQGWKVPTLPG